MVIPRRRGTSREKQGSESPTRRLATCSSNGLGRSRVIDGVTVAYRGQRALSPGPCVKSSKHHRTYLGERPYEENSSHQREQRMPGNRLARGNALDVREARGGHSRAEGQKLDTATKPSGQIARSGLSSARFGEVRSTDEAGRGNGGQKALGARAPQGVTNLRRIRGYSMTLAWRYYPSGGALVPRDHSKRAIPSRPGRRLRRRRDSQFRPNGQRSECVGARWRVTTLRGSALTAWLHNRGEPTSRGLK